MSTTKTSRPAGVRRSPSTAHAYIPRSETGTPRQLVVLAFETVLLIVSLALAVLVARHPAPLARDVPVALDIQHLLLPHKVVTQILDGVSAINWPIPSAIALVVATGVLLLLRRRLAALVTIATTALADGASFVTNEIVRRPRPSGHGLHILQHIGNYYSFPSGHVIHALALYGLLLYVTYQVRRPMAWLWVIRVTLAALIVLMPISRIVEGEHWPSDVLEGLLYGVFWLILGIGAYRWAWRRWPRARGSHEVLEGMAVHIGQPMASRQA